MMRVGDTPGQGWRLEPGPGSTDNHTRSRTGLRPSSSHTSPHKLLDAPLLLLPTPPFLKFPECVTAKG
eukprot:1749365-Amphidinium_carterae.1